MSDYHGLSEDEITYYNHLAISILEEAAIIWKRDIGDTKPTFDDLVSKMSPEVRDVVKLFLYTKKLQERNTKLGAITDRIRNHLSTLAVTLRDAQMNVTENGIFDGNGGVVVDAAWIIEFCQAMSDPLFLTETSDLANSLKIVNLGG